MANNPHAETYKGSTTFSGPIKAGSRWMDVPNYDRDTVPGTIAVKDLPNAGYVVCSQSCAVEQGSPLETITDIRLPAGSMTIAIQVIVTAAWTGTDKGYRLAVNWGAGQGAITDYIDLTAVGVYNFDPGTTINRIERWKNINFDNDRLGLTIQSVDIYGQSENAGDGRGIVTMNSVPGLNL